MGWFPFSLVFLPIKGQGVPGAGHVEGWLGVPVMGL